MSLSSLCLDAFQAVARAQSFSGAAKKLAITQSAISQRVLNLEDELGAALFVREPSGVRLTELGENLLRYCQSKELLENEFLSGLQSKSSGRLSGLLRVAGFSTITQSVLIPVVANLVQEHPDVQVEIMSGELRELPELLTTGRVDFIFLNRPWEKQGIECHQVGFEENVLIRPSLKKWREDVFLDHDAEDATTADFFRLQGKKTVILRRNYLDEIHAIIEGVKTGMGQAVVPLHLARKLKGIEIAPGYKPLKTPIYMCHYSQAFYTGLQKLVIERFQNEIPSLMG